MKRLIGPLLPLACIYMGCTFGNASKNAPQENETAYPVVEVIHKDTLLQMHYVAHIQAVKNVEIHARLEGILEKVYVDEGQTVRKGQLLFLINDEELKIELERTTAALNSIRAEAKVAEVEVQRVQVLVDKKIVSASELDLAEAKLNAIRAKVEQARAERSGVQKRLSYTSVHAPFDGIIDRLPLKEGSLLGNGSLLTTLSDIETMYAYFNLSENEYLQFVRSEEDSKGFDIALQLADGQTYGHKGSLQSAESEIDEKTGSIAFRVKFPNPEKWLKHGASGTVVLSKPTGKVLMVPQKSVSEIQDKNYVYVLGPDNTVRLTPFRPSQRLADYYLVGSGLSGKETIVYEGIQSLKDGEKIKPVFKKM